MLQRTMATETSMSGFTDDWQGERTLAECNLHMLKTSDTCDVSFRVGPAEEIVRAHSYILISRSCVFYSMFCGQWNKEGAIKIPDVSTEFFTEFLTFLYTDDCSLTVDNVTGLLYLSKKYAVHRLYSLCLNFLKINLTPENACVVLEQAHSFDENNLFQDAMKLIENNIQVILTSTGFNQLCKDCINKILILNDLDLLVKPEVVFESVLSWASAECSRQCNEVTPRNQRKVLGETVYLIGFTGFIAANFVQRVVHSKILDDNECLKILSHISCPEADVGRFRIVNTKYRPEICILHTAEMYDRSSHPSEEDITLFYEKFVVDAMNVECDQETLIHNITVPPSEATYKVVVKQAKNTLLDVECTTTLTNAKLDLSLGVKLKPGLIYCLQVKHTSGECPEILMTGVKDQVSIGEKTLKVSRNTTFSEPMRGLIMKLTVS